MGENIVAFQAFQETERASLSNLLKPQGIPKQIHMSLKGINIQLGKYELLESKNIKKAKQRLSQGGIAWNFFNEFYNPPNEYWLDTFTLSYILISDNKHLYKILYKNCHYTLSTKEIWMTWIQTMLQIATGDWEALSKTRKFYLEEMGQIKAIFFNTEVYQGIFDGFIEKDAQKIEKSLKIMESPAHKKPRMKEEVIEKYLSVQTIALAKLAWMHGMEVEIDSEYVPKELLPFEPLDEYTIPYKFLRDFYREQGVDWRYDPVYPELQDWDNDPENPNRKNGGFFKKLFS